MYLRIRFTTNFICWLVADNRHDGSALRFEYELSVCLCLPTNMHDHDEVIFQPKVESSYKCDVLLRAAVYDCSWL